MLALAVNGVVVMVGGDLRVGVVLMRWCCNTGQLARIGLVRLCFADQ
jgi:hypothetical protein